VQTLICIHSSASSPRQWDALRERLHGRFEIVAPALHGSGPGRIGRWLGRAPLRADVDLAADAIANAAEPVHLVGHSYGASVALRAARQNPTRIRSVVAYEPVTFALLRDDPESISALTEISRVASTLKHRLLRGELVAAARGFVDYWGGDSAWESLSHPQRHAITQRVPSVDANFDSLFVEQVTPADFFRFESPVLLLRGSRSRDPSRRVAQRLLESLPHVYLREMPGAGHLGPITHAKRFAELVARFLDRLELPEVRRLERYDVLKLAA